MKHHLPVIAICLLLGVAVNVAVAWTCVYRVGFGSFEARQYELVTGQYWTVMTWSAFGSGRIVSVRPVTGSGAVKPVGDRRPEIPPWSGIPNDAVLATATPNFLEAAEARGWPFLSLSATFAAATLSPSFAWDSRYGVEIRPPAHAANVYDASGRTLPLRPIWGGFVANTLLYAATIWLVSRVPAAWRRRIRRARGLCANCGYPPGNSAVCTECGSAVHRAATSLIPMGAHHGQCPQ
jgi:hypothetical protein